MSIPVARIDLMTGQLVTLDYAHHEVHGGSAFCSVVVDTSMGNSDTLNAAFKTPTGTKRVHLLIQFSTLVGGDLQLWEGATWTQGSGAAMPIINRKRLATVKDSMLLEDRAQATFTLSNEMISNVTGTNTAAATSLCRAYAFGSQNKAAGVRRGTSEWILKPGSTYLAVFTATGGSNKAELALDWYEHTDKEET